MGYSTVIKGKRMHDTDNCDENQPMGFKRRYTLDSLMKLDNKVKSALNFNNPWDMILGLKTGIH